jgi:5-methyltetrahydrofolate--homocysteine methyltransferase
MSPAASVSGFYFANPESNYFNVGPIGQDQFEALKAFSGRTDEDLKRALSSVLS